jgi:membrane protein YqaA with SNARE-associated domain
MRWFFSTFGFLLTWWGALIVSALDASLLVVLPFGVDAMIIYLAARHRDTFWVYPLVMSAGSVAGAALTFWIGVKVGDKGLPRLVSETHLDRLRKKVKNAGAGTLAVSALLPPPFPLTPFVLACGALEVDRTLFFTMFAAMRLVRFFVEALLARWQGLRVLRILQTDTFKTVVVALAALAVVATAASAVVLWRRTRGAPRHASRGNARHRHAV